MMTRFLLFALTLASLPGCRNQSGSSKAPLQSDQTALATEAKLPPDFLEFYQRFHRDSLYQIAHISWPLQGDASFQVDSTTYEKRSTTWEPQDWLMHRPVDFSSTNEYKRQWDVLGDELIVERISYAAANWGLERRFVKQFNGEWELVYYSDMQELTR